MQDAPLVIDSDMRYGLERSYLDYTEIFRFIKLSEYFHGMWESGGNIRKEWKIPSDFVMIAQTDEPPAICSVTATTSR